MRMFWTLKETSSISFFCNTLNLIRLKSKRDGLCEKAVGNSESEVWTERLYVTLYCSRIDGAGGFSEVWEIVKDTVKDSLGEHRASMMLFLDDLPLHLGAYHPLGTNNIVLNRTLVQIVEVGKKSKILINAFIYSLLVHEYLHALGHVPEAEVHSLIQKICRECFGHDHTVTKLNEKSPWAVLSDIPISGLNMPNRAMEIVKDFEKPNKEYII